MRNARLAGAGIGVALLAAVVTLSGLSRPLDLAIQETVQIPLGHWDGEPPSPTDTNGSVRGAWRVDHALVGRVSEMGHYLVSYAALAALTVALLTAGAWRSAVVAAGWGVVNAMLTSFLQHVLHPLSQPLRVGVAQPLPSHFPSGHTMGAIVTWGLVAMLLARHIAPLARSRPALPAARVAAWATGTLGVLVALDRVLAGQHVLGDVVGGAGLGMASLGAALALDAWWSRPPRAGDEG